MPIASAIALAAALSFTPVPVPVVAASIDAIPTHPTVAARGWFGLVAEEGKKSCEVSVWRLAAGRVEAAHRAPCVRGDVFYYLLPAAAGDGAELVALGADGLARVFPAPRAPLIRSRSFALVPPAVRAPGPELWLEDDESDAAGALRVAIPGLGDITIWERGEEWRRVASYPITVDARYNPRVGRDTLSPDFHLLAHLRMPKWALGKLDAAGATGLVFALENEVTGTLPEPVSDGSQRDLFHVEKTLFADDPEGSDPRLVRGNRIGDIDADGQLDVALVAARGGITHLETALEVWFGPLAESLSRKADASLRGSGAAIGTELVDVDRDRRLEAFRPRIEVSVAAFVRILLFGEVRVDYDFFDVARGQHERQHSFCSFARTFPVDLEGLSAKAAPLFTLEGDFDGDGLADVLTGEGTEGYAILRGLRGEAGRWCASDGDGFPIPVEKAERFVVQNLDGDGKSDLIVIRDAGARDSTVTLLVSS